jgi:hypothetical protein
MAKTHQSNPPKDDSLPDENEEIIILASEAVANFYIILVCMTSNNSLLSVHTNVEILLEIDQLQSAPLLCSQHFFTIFIFNQSLYY